MPGTFILKPIEANIKPDAPIRTNIHNIDPYCQVNIGAQHLATHPSKNHGTHPVWDEELVIQQCETTQGELVVKDKHGEQRIGNVKFDLEDARSRGKVHKWFNIYNNNQVQGQLLLDITFTSGNPQSRAWHQSSKEGYAIASPASDWPRYNLHASQDELQHMREDLAHGMINPNKAALNANKRTEDYTRPQQSLAHQQPLGSKPVIDPRYNKDPTLKDLHITDNTADTGMSNPNTMKLGINHGAGPLGATNPYNEDRQTQNQYHRREGSARYNNDPTLRDLHLNGNSANTGMSNPNTAKLGINHAEGPFGVTNPYDKNNKGNSLGVPYANQQPTGRSPVRSPHQSDSRGSDNENGRRNNQGGSYGEPSKPRIQYMSDPNLAGVVNENVGHTGHQNFHHHNLIHRDNLGPNKGVDPRYNNDPTLRDLHLTGNTANTGMSNPNTAKLGVNHGAGPFGVQNPYDQDRNVLNQGRNGGNGAACRVDPTLKDLHLTDNTADTGMSNPNTMKLGINHEAGPFGVTNPYDQTKPDRSPGRNYNAPATRDYDYDYNNGRQVRKGSFNPEGVGMAVPENKMQHRKSTDLTWNNRPMSNPNNAKYGVNRNIGHTGNQNNFHENVAVNEHLGPTGPSNDYDRNLASIRAKVAGDIGASNPNNAGLRRPW